MGFSANSSWTYDESNNQIFWFDNCLKTCQKLNTSWLMLTGQLVQRLRLFYWSKTTFATVPRTFGMTVSEEDITCFLWGEGGTFLWTVLILFFICSPCQARWAFAITWRPLTFHILIFSSETAKPIDLKFGRKHL
jgi:hypothetical protein